MLHITLLPEVIIYSCISDYLSKKDKRALYDTNKTWYEYKKRSWFITIKGTKILDNLNILQKLVKNVAKQVAVNLSCYNIIDVSKLGLVHTLNLSGCHSITDVSKLGLVHTLDLSYCHSITDVSNLGLVHTLNLSGCCITDVSNLGNVHI
jgi:hypothetical protein